MIDLNKQKLFRINFLLLFLFVLACLSSLQAENKKIILVEGIEDKGKMALVEQLSSYLQERATIYYTQDAVSESDLLNKIENDEHEVIILIQSWLSQHAKAYASKKADLDACLIPLYQPTHLFFVTSQEETKNRNLGPLLTEDTEYKNRYRFYCQSMMKKMKWKTLCLEVDQEVLSSEKMIKQLVELIDLDLTILDPRNMIKRDKRELRPHYLSWEAHREAPDIDSLEYTTIIPNADNCPLERRQGGQFEHIDQPFKYSCFSKPRDNPVKIGMLQKKELFDDPFPNKVWQIQDLPIAFPTESQDQYEYRLPKCLEAFTEFVQKTADAWQKFSSIPHKYYAYLTVSHDIVPPFKWQRRPSVHSDGFKSARIEEGACCDLGNKVDIF